MKLNLGDEKLPGHLRSELTISSLHISLAYHSFINSAQLSVFASTLRKLKVQDEFTIDGDEKYLEMSFGDLPARLGMNLMPVHIQSQAYNRTHFYGLYESYCQLQAKLKAHAAQSRLDDAEEEATCAKFERPTVRHKALLVPRTFSRHRAPTISRQAGASHLSKCPRSESGYPHQTHGVGRLMASTQEVLPLLLSQRGEPRPAISSF